MQNDYERISKENSELKEHLIRTECQSRRENLILDGIEEKVNKNDSDCLKSVYEILENEMGLQNARNIKIQLCHRKQVFRLKPSEKNPHPKPRPIIFKMHYYADRERIWKASSNLKSSDLVI